MCSGDENMRYMSICHHDSTVQALITNLPWCKSSAFFLGKYGLCSGSAFKLKEWMDLKFKVFSAATTVISPTNFLAELTDRNFVLVSSQRCTTNRMWIPFDWKSCRLCTKRRHLDALHAHRGTHDTLGILSQRSHTFPGLLAHRCNGN